MEIGILILIIYLLSNYYIFNNKNLQLKQIFYSSLVYQTLLLLLLVFQFNLKLFVVYLILGISHYFIHMLYYYFYTRTSKKNLLFISEQILQFFIILFVDQYLTYEYSFITNNQTFFKIVLSLLLIGLPCNVLFKMLFKQFKPEDKDEIDQTFKNAGATIGVLERILILICLINTLYTSIGLIFTAKSIARYKRINDEPAFSEYYLIGTLSSVLFTVLVYIFVFHFL